MKYVMKVNVDHDGKMYEKGSEIKESDPGFKVLVAAGWAEAVVDAKEEVKASEKKAGK